jgi:hypothetical protein
MRTRRRALVQTAITVILPLVLILGVSPRNVAAQETIITHHRYEECAKAPSPEPGIIEVRRCSGPSGIAVMWKSEPDSSSISFGNNPLAEDLEIGSAFEAGTAIEWRSGKTGTTPVAAIVRYRTGDSVGKLGKSRLVVHRIERSGQSCIMAVLTGDDASSKARLLIDGSAERFVCGTSKRTDQ